MAGPYKKKPKVHSNDHLPLTGIDACTTALSYAILHHIPTPILVLNRNFFIKLANKAFYKIFHLTEEETLGKVIFELEDNGWKIPGLYNILLEVREEKVKVLEKEITYKFPHTGLRTICFNIQSIHEGGEQYLLVVPDDITQKKDTEQFLKEKANGALEERKILHDFFMQTPAMFCILTGAEHTFEFANEPYRQLIGNRNPVGKTLKEALPEIEGQGFPEILDRVFQTGEPHVGKEMPATLARNGKMEQVFVDFNYHPLKNEAGEIEGILVFCYDVTEKVMARQKITESETRYRNLIYGLPAAIYVCDEKGYITSYNESAAQLWGRRPELGKEKWCGSWKCFTADGKPISHNQSPMAAAIREGRTGNSEVIIQRPDGAKRYAIQHLQLEHDSHGKVTGAIDTLIDITDQIVARKEIQQNADMIKNVYMNAPAFMCILNGPDLIYGLVNPEYQKIYGTKKLLGLSVLDAHPELRGTFIEELLYKVYKTGETHVGTELLLNVSRDEGQAPEPTYFNFSYQPTYTLEKEIDGILVFGYEVTKQVLAKKKGEEDLRQIMDSLPQITSTALADGTNIYFNKFFLDYSGLTLEEALKTGWSSVMHPDEIKDTMEEWKRHSQSGEDFNRAIRLKRKSDGIYRWYFSHATALKNDKNEITLWIATATDIHEQVLKDQKKDEFISIASHEMKTPLTTAKAYLQLLAESIADDEESGTYARKASNAIEELNGLVSDLLDVSKIRNGKLNYNITDFDFNEMLDSAIENVQFASSKHTIIKSGVLTKKITGDKGRLQQVVINLLSNAVKYSPAADKVFLTVEQKGNEIKVSVKDKGIGLSKNNLEKIFEKYYRVEMDNPEQFQGMGIGLFISHEIIKRHKGKLWAVSKPGKGSTFAFSLPIQVLKDENDIK